MTMSLQKPGQGGRQLGVDEKTHGGSAGEEHGVVGLSCGVIETSLNVGALKVGEVLEDFGLRDTGGEEVEHVLDANAHAADAGAASTLGGIEGDTVFHEVRIADAGGGVKSGFGVWVGRGRGNSQGAKVAKGGRRKRDW
jgi:hypothetical protein